MKWWTENSIPKQVIYSPTENTVAKKDGEGKPINNFVSDCNTTPTDCISPAVFYEK
jgi:hypothetical protein